MRQELPRRRAGCRPPECNRPAPPRALLRRALSAQMVSQATRSYCPTIEIHRHATEMAALAPDAILAAATSSVLPLLQATRTVPIIFTATNDPVGAGFVDSLARPGGNATGFMNWEFSMGAKWLELLKQIAPGVTRVAVLRDAS